MYQLLYEIGAPALAHGGRCNRAYGEYSSCLGITNAGKLKVLTYFYNLFSLAIIKKLVDFMTEATISLEEGTETTNWSLQSLYITIWRMLSAVFILDIVKNIDNYAGLQSIQLISVS